MRKQSIFILFALTCSLLLGCGSNTPEKAYNKLSAEMVKEDGRWKFRMMPR